MYWMNILARRTALGKGVQLACMGQKGVMHAECCDVIG